MVRRAVVGVMVAGALMVAGAAHPNAGQPAAPPKDTTMQTDLPRGEFCVSPDGSDQATGSKGEPWRTIRYAVDHAAPGSVVQVRAGVYHESVQIANRGTSSATFTVRGYPGERPVLDGDFRPADGVIVSGDHVRVSGLEIRNYCGCQAASGHPVLSTNSSGLQDAHAASLVVFSRFADTPTAGG
jgi:hypothetical protein